ncbi:hypothetical protein [Gelidibacter salicanalis]|uniref:Uncharacterized protein n=1 Tax=Gelidibacter salicanalis TaxID=291193 RepID=A0A934KSL6_9FLAO|nr:hypothetical protein [Gelidibacter salicanalis]MBJ7879963.1 hypothetical protein [Gelidibacter salicanalis]
MDEFLRQNYNTLTHSVEVLGAATGIICFNKYKKTGVKYFILFLIYATIVDYFGSYPVFLKRLNRFELIENSIFEKNYLYFTVFWGIGSALFYTFFYRKILNNKGRKRFLRYAAILFLIGAGCHIFFNLHSSSSEYRIIIFVFGSLLILLSVCFYFIEILESDKVLTFYKSIYFWISSVILIWFLITTPLLFYEIYFSTADWNFVFLKWQIYLAANMFMYLSFTFALLWCKPENA